MSPGSEVCILALNSAKEDVLMPSTVSIIACLKKSRTVFCQYLAMELVASLSWPLQFRLPDRTKSPFKADVPAYSRLILSRSSSVSYILGLYYLTYASPLLAQTVWHSNASAHTQAILDLVLTLVERDFELLL
jgi:hypothetical protein